MTDNADTNEMMRVIATAPPGTFKVYRGRGTGVEEYIHAHMSNLGGITERIQQAYRAGCLIEVVSLRLQVIDYWLRIFFANKAPAGERRQREFGRLLGQCKDLGLDLSLFTRLKNFNDHRIRAIHGYVIGHTTYENLEPVVRESRSLSTDLIIFVLENCGSVITALGGTFEVGDMILNVSAQIAHLQATRDIA